VTVHLCFNDLPQVLHDMEPNSDLLRLRCGLSVEATPISADHFNLEVSLEPVGAGDDTSIFKSVDHHATFRIHNDHA
jgi:hypothetical protein